MLDDDEATGRVLTRREALTVLGASGFTLLGARYVVAQSFQPRRPRFDTTGKKFLPGIR